MRQENPKLPRSKPVRLGLHGRVVWWVSCNKFTCIAETDKNGVLTYTCAMLHKFLGQPLDNLLLWANKFGGLEYGELHKIEKKGESNAE